MGVKYGSEREKELEEKLQGEKRVEGNTAKRRKTRSPGLGRWRVGGGISGGNSREKGQEKW